MMESIVLILIITAAGLGMFSEPDSFLFFIAIMLTGGAFTLLALRIVCGLNLVALVPI